MIKKLIILSCFILLISPVEAKKIKTFQPLRQPLVTDYANQQVESAMPNENYPKITELEYAIFKRGYERENIYNRLSRLEKRIFRRDFAQMPLINRVDNLLANVDTGIMYGISSNDISKLERKVLGRTFLNEDSDSRITRLEKEMLGAMQGGDLRERFETVKTAAKHYNSYPEIINSQNYYNQSNQYYTPSSNWSSSKMNGGLNGLMQNILGMIFGGFTPGTMTGYTPPIYDPYNPYANQFNPGMGTQDYYMGTTGGYMNNRNIGNTSTVRILD